MAGPIERSGNLLRQINRVEQIKLWNYRRITEGAVLMLWGYFLKMVIADRVSIVVDQVYDSIGCMAVLKLSLLLSYLPFRFIVILQAIPRLQSVRQKSWDLS